jgi:hypothetical protein
LPFSVATGDFNGDGKADLVVADGCAVPSCDPHQSAVSIHLGNGDGTFGAPQQYLAGFYANVVVVDDFNRDGKQDLAVADFCSDPQCSDPNGSISVLLGNGDGTFQSPLSYLTGSAPFGIAAEDLNGDGNEDLVTADTFQATISVLLGNGDGTFRPKVDYATDLTPIAVVIADFNGDHKLDVVTANYSPADAPGNLSILFGNGDGTFQPHQEFFNYLGNPSTVAAGDLNRDGNLDIVTTTTSCNVADSIVILFGKGGRHFPIRPSVFHRCELRIRPGPVG